MLNCHDATRLMSKSQERPLSILERMSLKMHLMMCSGCRNYREHMSAIRLMTRAFVKQKDESDKK